MIDESLRSPRCSIVIPVHNRASLTQHCLDVLLNDPPRTVDLEIIVVDDGSSDSTADLLSGYGDRIRVVTHEENKGFATTCNDGAAAACGQYVVFLNNDVVPTTGWLDALVAYADEHPEVGVVGSKLLYPNGTIQHAGVVICQDRFPRHIYTGFPGAHAAVNKSRRYSAVTAACMLVERVLFQQLGGFDTAFTNSYEDTDFCLRLGQETGREVHYCHESVLYHLESVSRVGRGREEAHNTRLFGSRWGQSVLPNDFHYYCEDGLIRVEYSPLYPLRMSVTPELMVVGGAERDNEADRLLDERSRQVHELMKRTISLSVQLSERKEKTSPEDSENGERAAARIPHPPVSYPFGVNLAGYLASEKGVGEAARSRVRALQAAGIPYVLNEVVDLGSDNTDTTFSEFSSDSPYAVSLLQMNAEQVPYFAEERAAAYFEGRYRVGSWFWELPTFPPEWVPAFDYFNELWVPSTFVFDALSRVSPIPVLCIPTSIPFRSPGGDSSRAAFDLPEDRFLFLFSFDFQSVIERKNPLALIEAFKRAFPAKRFGHTEAVGLVLKCNHSDFASDRFEEMRAQCEDYPIFVVDGTISREEMDRLTSICDSYASLHRSEGYGLGIAEAMMMGKPVVATGYSGNMDFTTGANSFLVDHELVPIPETYGPYKDSVWAEPDLEHAARQLRLVYERPEIARAVAERGRRDVLSRFHPGVEGDLVRERLHQLAEFGRIPEPEPAGEERARPIKTRQSGIASWSAGSQK